MKRRLYAAATLALSVICAWAMPTDEEIRRVQPLIAELMSVHENEYKANRKTAKEVGDAALDFVNDAKSEAAKYVLLKGAILYYSLAKDFDKAADAIEAIQSQIKDVPASEMEVLASKALARAGKNGAQRLRDIHRVASEQTKATMDIDAFKAELRKKPGDAAAMRGLADAYVRFGDWPRALKVFAALGIEAAIYERNPADAKGCNTLKAADYWWECPAKNPAPYRIHAAELYRKAIEDNLVDGLMKTLVEKRIVVAASGGSESPRAANTATGGSRAPSGKRYCIIDLSPGPNAKKYSVSWRDSAPPSSGWEDIYKTTKLVLRRIEPGTFIMGENQKDESRRVTFTKPFYIGVFEVTQWQFALVTGDDPSKHKGKMRPATDVSLEMLRGSCVEYDWPTSRKVAPNSFLGRIRARTGLDGFELPIEAQWEYACRAGTTTLRYDGSDLYDIDRMVTLGRVSHNQKMRGWKEPKSEFIKHKPDGKGGYMEYHTSVGMYKPNAWGLYDMYGNVWEWCVSRKYDAYGENPLGKLGGPKDHRARCGGSWMTSRLQSHYVSFFRPWDRFDDLGFRLVLNVDE